MNLLDRHLAQAGVAAALLVAGVALPAYWVQSQAQDARVMQWAEVFPHAKHARLFTSCEGCHAGIATAARDSTFPAAAVCNACHNGTDAKVIEWAPPRRSGVQGLLKFTHRTHFRVDTSTTECDACHSVAGQTRFMEVVLPARAAQCLDCHKQNVSSHFDAANECSTCHVTLSQAAALSVDAIRALPRPPTHLAQSFIQAHAPTTAVQRMQCATCHAKESCARCHVNASAVEDIVALDKDARIADVVATLLPLYPVPASHTKDDFAEQHGADATTSTSGCANCHTRSSCESCHTGQGAARVIRALPAPTSGAPGVKLQRRPTRLVEPLTRGVRAVRMLAPAPVPSGRDTISVRRSRDTAVVVVRPHPQGFLDGHRSAAAAGAQTCAGCHTTRFCSDCHAGESRRNFHPANFVAGHSAPTYARDRSCSSCHNTEVFCRSCHVASGIAPSGGSAAVYHNAQPQWLLQHGRAARYELTTCVSCHTQKSCLRCHATTGWGVSPHGDSFDAERLGRKAMAMCARCHIADPRRKR